MLVVGKELACNVKQLASCVSPIVTQELVMRCKEGWVCRNTDYEVAFRLQPWHNFVLQKSRIMLNVFKDIKHDHYVKCLLRNGSHLVDARQRRYSNIIVSKIEITASYL